MTKQNEENDGTNPQGELGAVNGYTPSNSERPVESGESSGLVGAGGVSSVASKHSPEMSLAEATCLMRIQNADNLGECLSHLRTFQDMRMDEHIAHRDRVIMALIEERDALAADLGALRGSLTAERETTREALKRVDATEPL